MTIRGEDLLITGSWALLIGAIVDTIWQTQQTLTSPDLDKDLVIKGDEIEAFGNALQAFGRTKLLASTAESPNIYTIFRSWIEAAGNIANAISVNINMNVNKDEGLKIDSLGSGIQSLGSAFEAVGAYIANDSSFKSLSIAGNSLVSLGSFIESTGDIFLLQDKIKTGEQLLLIGSWVQLIGMIILLDAISIEVETIGVR